MDHPRVKTETITTADGRKVRFIDNYWTFAVAVAFIGPLALPLYWRNPRASLKAKIAMTALVIAFTAFLLWFSGNRFKTYYDQIQQIREMLRQAQ